MPDITITSTPDAFDAAAKVLLNSLNRGDFDDDPDFDYAAGETCGRFAQAFLDADASGEETTTAQVNSEHLDEILAVIESDFRAESAVLKRFIADANTSIATATP
jgi:hypothetical protein